MFAPHAAKCTPCQKRLHSMRSLLAMPPSSIHRLGTTTMRTSARLEHARDSTPVPLATSFTQNRWLGRSITSSTRRACPARTMASAASTTLLTLASPLRRTVVKRDPPFSLVSKAAPSAARKHRPTKGTKGGEGANAMARASIRKPRRTGSRRMKPRDAGSGGGFITRTSACWPNRLRISVERVGKRSGSSQTKVSSRLTAPLKGLMWKWGSGMLSLSTTATGSPALTDL